jgi:hypothetical protein
MKSKIIERTALAVVLAGLLPCLGSQTQWKGTISKEGDVVVVRNPKEPIYKDPDLSIREDFAIGGAGASADSSFGKIRTVAVGDDGRVYVLDGQDRRVEVFDSTGRYLKTFGRRGQGPGELSSASSMSIIRKNSEIMVLDTSSRRLSFFDLEGAFLRQISMKDVWGLRARADSRGRIYIEEGILDPKDPRYALKKFTPDLSFVGEIARFPAPTPTEVNPLAPLSSWVIDDDDRLVYGYPETYQIRVFGPADKVVMRIERPFDPVEITEAEKEEQRKEFPPELMGETKVVFGRYHSAYQRIFLSDEGDIFVQTWEKTKDGKILHDHFDGEGRFISRIPLAEGGIEIRNGKYYAIEEDSDGYQSLKRYSVEWKFE